MDGTGWLVLAFVIVGAFWVVGRRRGARPTGSPNAGQATVLRRGRDREELPPLTAIADVRPIPSPPGLAGASTRAAWTGRNAAARGIHRRDRSQVSADDLPKLRGRTRPASKAKKRCRGFGKEIFVRSGPDGLRHLLSASERECLEAQWAEHFAGREATAMGGRERAEAEWMQTLRSTGLAIGEYELDVVGESHYHAALAGVRAALTTEVSAYEVRGVAALQREPTNRFDPNAIQVLMHGERVGYLDRYSAEEYQPVIKQYGPRMYVQAVMLGGRPDGDVVGPIGVRLLNVPEPA